jgi:DNA-binding PucR family transcriptional regulator
MELTIRAALQFGGLKDARVVAGLDSIGHDIKSITVLEVAEALISRWVIKDQLYITSFYAIKDDVDQQKNVIRALCSSGCCGLVICHIDLWIKQMHPSVVALCNELHFPLIVAKSEVSYIEILNPIIAHLMNLDRHYEHNYANIRNDFLDLIINQDDSYAVFKSFAERIGHKISFIDLYFESIYSNKTHAEVQSEIIHIKNNLNQVNEECREKNHSVYETEDCKKVVCLIHSSKNIFGLMVIDCEKDESTDGVLEIAEPLKTSCALLFSRKNRVSDIKERYLQEYSADLLVWNFRSDEIAIRKGQEVDLDICGKNVAVTVNINAFQQNTDTAKQQVLLNYLKSNVLPYMREVARFYNPANIVIYRSDIILVLMENRDKRLDLRKICEKFLALFQLDELTTVSIGISDYFENVSDIPEAFNQSFHSAMIGRSYYGENHVATYVDVWFLFKIREMRKDKTAVGMCRKLLEPLESYDKAQQTNLTETMFCLIMNNMDNSLCAKLMYTHRNTLLYRKSRIIEILGYSPFEMPHIINFIMAYEISRQSEIPGL